MVPSAVDAAAVRAPGLLPVAMWTNIGLSVALACGLAVAGAGLYLEGKKAGKNEVRAQVASNAEIARDAAETAAQIAADAISKIKVQNRTVYQEVQREVLERAVYRDCVHSPEQLQRINAAITGQPAEPAGRGLVPPADPAGGLKLRGNDAEADRGGGAVPGMPGGGAR